MNDEQKSPPGSGLCKWSGRIGIAGVVITLIGVFGAALDMLGPFPAMMSMTLGSLLLVVGAILAGIGLIRSRGTAGAASYPLTIASLVVGVAALINAVIFTTGGGGPPIHDVSTDTDSPPAFVAIVPLRADAPNPPEYAGAETAAMQKGAYPDIETIVLIDPRTLVFDTALAVAEDMGWEIVDSDMAEGRIEATATTPWVGFKDDVVIRVQARSAETLVDVRSKSRIGRGDMGVNAKRIRAFRERLIEALEP